MLFMLKIAAAIVIHPHEITLIENLMLKAPRGSAPHISRSHLSSNVADHLKLNPTSGQIFLFRNRHANKIKLLWWERNGFWLCYKRLEQGKLKLDIYLFS